MVPRGSHRHCALTAHCVACQALQLYGSMADHMQCTFKPELDAVRPFICVKVPFVCAAHATDHGQQRPTCWADTCPAHGARCDLVPVSSCPRCPAHTMLRRSEGTCGLGYKTTGRSRSRSCRRCRPRCDSRVAVRAGTSTVTDSAPANNMAVLVWASGPVERPTN